MEYTTQAVDLHYQSPSQATLQPALGHQHSTTSCLRAKLFYLLTPETLILLVINQNQILSGKDNINLDTLLCTIGK